VFDFLEQTASKGNFNQKGRDAFKALLKLKMQLKSVLKQYVESVTIQMSSERILNFLVNDILDFAQLRAGKFRKNKENFLIEQAVEELVKVQNYKAEQMGISVQTFYENFDSRTNKSDKRMICTDMQRLQ